MSPRVLLAALVGLASPKTRDTALFVLMDAVPVRARGRVFLVLARRLQRRWWGPGHVR